MQSSYCQFHSDHKLFLCSLIVNLVLSPKWWRAWGKLHGEEVRLPISRRSCSPFPSDIRGDAKGQLVPALWEHLSDVSTLLYDTWMSPHSLHALYPPGSLSPLPIVFASLHDHCESDCGHLLFPWQPGLNSFSLEFSMFVLFPWQKRCHLALRPFFFPQNPFCSLS